METPCRLIAAIYTCVPYRKVTPLLPLRIVSSATLSLRSPTRGRNSIGKGLFLPVSLLRARPPPRQNCDTTRADRFLINLHARGHEKRLYNFASSTALLAATGLGKQSFCATNPSLRLNLSFHSSGFSTSTLKDSFLPMATTHVAHGRHGAMGSETDTVHSSHATAHIHALAMDHVSVFAMHHMSVVCMHGCVA
jgi:hypothetical protein